MNWGRVTGDWSVKPTIIVGAGRSLIGFDLAQLEGLGHVLAVNAAVHDLPFADAVVSIDLAWPKLTETRRALTAFDGEVYLGIPVDQPEDAAHYPDVTYLKRRRRCDGLSDDPTEIEAAGTSGHGALNVAYLKKAKHIFLFGFDYNGGGHYCQERYGHEKSPTQNDLYWPRWALNFDECLPQLYAAGVHVINASPFSNIQAFPRCTPDEAINILRGTSR